MERMDDFFRARVEIYDEHMLNNIQGIQEAYLRIAELLPEGIQSLLDLGCGTGLELATVFQRFPNLHVTGVDITQSMLDKLIQKYPTQRIKLLCDDYFKLDLGVECYDAAISFQTLHHFSHDEKRTLYRKILQALHPFGIYLEADYIANSQAEEDKGFEERAKFTREYLSSGKNVDPKAYHIDVPCTVKNQVRLLSEAGFSHVKCDKVWENMAIFIATA